MFYFFIFVYFCSFYVEISKGHALAKSNFSLPVLLAYYNKATSFGICKEVRMHLPDKRTWK